MYVFVYVKKNRGNNNVSIGNKFLLNALKNFSLIFRRLICDMTIDRINKLIYNDTK